MNHQRSGEVYHADTMLVAPYHVWSFLNRIDLIGQWAPDIVRCSVIENSAHPSSIGCLRRTLLHAAPYEDTVLREVLEEVGCEGPNEWSLVLRFIPTDADATSPLVHQSVVQELRTSWRLLSVPQDPNKTFVSVTARFTVAALTIPEHDPHRLAVESAYDEVTAFLQWWLQRTHKQLSDYVISVAYPLREGKLSMDHRKRYEQFEEVVVNLAARKDIPVAWSATMESLLQAWVDECKKSDHKDSLMFHLRQDVAAARRIAEDLAKQNAAQHSERGSSGGGVVAEGCSSDATLATNTANADARATPTALDSTQTSTDGAGLLRATETTTTTGTATTTTGKPSIPAPPTTASVGAPSSDTSSPPYALPPVVFDPSTISKSVVNGHLDEQMARRAFHQLDTRNRGFLGLDELCRVLSAVEHFGLFEDKNGVVSELELQRQRAKTPIRSLAEERSLPESSQALTPREKERAQKEERSQAMAAAMRTHAERWMKKYAKKQAGKLTFDEFCLLLLQRAVA